MDRYGGLQTSASLQALLDKKPGTIEELWSAINSIDDEIGNRRANISMLRGLKDTLSGEDIRFTSRLVRDDIDLSSQDERYREPPVFVIDYDELYETYATISSDDIIKAKEWLRLPYQSMWFEVRSKHNPVLNNTALFMEEADEKLSFNFIFRSPNVKGSGALLPGIAEIVPQTLYINKSDSFAIDTGMYYNPEQDHMSVGENIVKGMMDLALNRMMGIVFITLILLNGVGIIERVSVKASPKLNSKRAKRGKPALSDYTRLSLSRTIQQYEKSIESAGHKKKLHFVRGHPRVIKSGKVTWVKAHLRGKTGGVSGPQYRIKS